MWSCKTSNPPSHVSFLKFILAAICGYYGRGDCASLSWCPWRCNCKRVSSFSLLKNVLFRLTCLFTTHIKKSMPHDAHPKKSVRLNPPVLPRDLSSPLPNLCMSYRCARISVWEMVQTAKETYQFNPTDQMLREVNLFWKMSKVQSNSITQGNRQLFQNMIDADPQHMIDAEPSHFHTHTHSLSLFLTICVCERECVRACMCVCAFLLIGLFFSLTLSHLCSHRVHSGKSRSYLANQILLGNPIRRSLPKRKRYLTIR